MNMWRDHTILQECVNPCHRLLLLCVYYLITKHWHVTKENLLKTLTESWVFYLTYSFQCGDLQYPTFQLFTAVNITYVESPVRLCKSLCKYNRISHCYISINLNKLTTFWVIDPVSLFVCHAYNMYTLYPSTLFGCSHSYQTSITEFSFIYN